jgi:hypothetical protein
MVISCIDKYKNMEHNAISIRPFIGSKDFNLSRSFYREWGFEETILTENMSVFKTGAMAFYLQDGYVKDWIDNTMIFLEVIDINRYWKELLSLDLQSKYKMVKIVPIKKYDWGNECFVHDPSGILWHIGSFTR